MNAKGFESEAEALEQEIKAGKWRVAHPLSGNGMNPIYIKYERLTGAEVSSFLCEWEIMHQEIEVATCLNCPFFKEYGGCHGNNAPYYLWKRSQHFGEFEPAQEAAIMYLEQLKALKGESKRERLWKWVKHILRGGN